MKCSLKDLDLYNKKNDINNFNNSQKIENFSLINSKNTELGFQEFNNFNTNMKIEKKIKNDFEDIEDNEDTCDNERKIIWKKLKDLEINLHNNNISDKKSACFWCTCNFDNPPIFIPKYQLNSSYFVYGCFCSPECSTAFLMNENIDTATKFERYHLLNFIYCKIYEYKKNIKPAPDPHYTLDKFYGNLSIQEFRRLLKNERLLLIVDKPLTRILPELCEENDDFVINCNSIPSSNKYTFRKNVTKQTKTDILQEKFGIKT